MEKITIIKYFYFQDCCYGIDWSRPVSTNDNSIVIVSDLPTNLLTEHQKLLLTEELQQYSDTKVCVEHILASAFISNCHLPT